VSTTTRTTTATRAELIRINLEVAVYRLLDNAPRLVEQVIRPAVKHRFLRRIDFWAIDDRGLCHAHLRLAVDWTEHERQVMGSSKVRIDGRWVEQVAPEVRVLLEGFEQTVAERGLQVRASLGVTPGQDRESASRHLGLRRWQSCAWADHPASTTFRVKGLTELEVALDLADENRSTAAEQ
jgi:hypothetical protein